MPSKKTPKKQPSIRERALKLLQDPDFFGKVREAVERGGLVGEERNALAIYVNAISALLEKPISTIAKGVSSAGKNFLVSRVLRLIPETAIREITSSSRTAWNYSGEDFRHKIVYLQERNDAAGAVHPVRLLISEGRLIREVTVRQNGQWTKQRFVAEGPIAAISTTTRDRIEMDDETRNVSVWMDDSIEQTRRIIERQLSPLPPLEDDEIEVWHEVYGLVQKRASVPVELPEWFAEMKGKIFVNNVRVRRYFPAFLTAVRTIALIRSFKRHPEDFEADESIIASFLAYAKAAYIFDSAFVESLNRGDDECLETSKAIESIASTQDGEPVDADQLAKFLGVSYDIASAKLRSALKAGVISRANESEKNNNKLYLPAEPPRFVPDPKEVARELVRLKKPVTVVHPLTGKTVKFETR
jgi:hypothetical protein